MEDAAVTQIRDLTSLSQKVARWTWASIAAQVALSAFSALEAIALAERMPSAEIDWLDSVLSPGLDFVAGVVAVVMVVVVIVSSVLSLRWIYLANKNAHVFANGLAISPGWSVGWFFVPIANLWKPFEAVEQVWRGSKDPPNWPALEIPVYLRWWWAFWLLTTISGTISTRLEIQGGTAGARLAADVLDVASTVLFIPAAMLFLRIVREVTALQASRGGEINPTAAAALA